MIYLPTLFLAVGLYGCMKTIGAYWKAEYRSQDKLKIVCYDPSDDPNKKRQKSLRKRLLYIKK